MSETPSSLAIDFIKLHPDNAARILEQHHPRLSAELLTRFDTDVAACVLHRMLPQYASQICLTQDAKTTAQLLHEVEASYVAAILRYPNRALREQILAFLPSQKQAACLLLLSFSEDTVGSLMIPDVVTLPEDCAVAEAQEYVRKAGEVMQSDFIYVVNRNRQLSGLLNSVELLRAPADSEISSLSLGKCQALFSRMSISKAAQHEAWSRVDVMPVINRNSQFVGALRHVDLRKGLERLTHMPSSENRGNPLAGLFETYGTTLMTLVGSLDAMLIDPDDSRRTRK